MSRAGSLCLARRDSRLGVEFGYLVLDFLTERCVNSLRLVPLGPLGLGGLLWGLFGGFLVDFHRQHVLAPAMMNVCPFLGIRASAFAINQKKPPVLASTV
jgi:hypothetical protein